MVAGGGSIEALGSWPEGTGDPMAGAHVAGRSPFGGRVQRGATGRGPWAVAAGLVVAALFLLVVIGGYSLHWRWTGLSDSVALWDWLQVLALPVAVAATPILVRHRRALQGGHRRVLGAGALAVGALVIAGYLVPMGWTGFSGNTLWDWLELLLLPVVVATASVWATTWPPARSHIVVVACAMAALAVVAVLAYTIPWRWTGFAGNTAWDWIKLLLLPLMVPVVLVPPVARYLSDRLAAQAPPDPPP
jgi:hypothetical protein